MDRDYTSLDIREILFLIRKNIILIVLLAVLGGIITFTQSKYFKIPQYQSDVTLLVNMKETDGGALYANGQQMDLAKKLVDTYIILLTNDELLTDVINTLGLSTSPGGLRGRISASAINQTAVMRVTARYEDADTARKILEEISLRAPDVLSQIVGEGTISIISKPKANYGPISPNVRNDTMIGIVAGLAIAFSYIIIKKLLANTFLSDEDIENHLGMPILGIIPTIK